MYLCFLQLDPYRTSLWEAVGLSEIRKTKFDADEDYGGIEERRPAATVAGSNFFTGGARDENVHAAIDAGDSSFDTSRRHEASSASSGYGSSRSSGQTYSTDSFESSRSSGRSGHAYSESSFEGRQQSGRGGFTAGSGGQASSTGGFEESGRSGHAYSEGGFEGRSGFSAGSRSGGQASSTRGFEESGRSGFSAGSYEGGRSGGQGFSAGSSSQDGRYNGSVTIAAERGGGYAVVPAGDRGINTATIQRISRYNTTFRDGVPIGRTYENTTIVRDAQGRVIDQQTQHAQAEGSRQAVYTASGGSSQPYPVHIPTTTHHFDWDAPAGTQEQHYNNRVEGSVQRNQQAHVNQYYDRNGQVVGGGYQNKQDREFHTRGQDVRGYGGTDRRYDEEQLSAAVGSQHQQSAIENAAAGHGFRTNVINMDGGAGKNIF